MRHPEFPLRCKSAAGFTLPAILVVVGALLILAVGALLLVGIERNTARSFVDRERAELAARAGFEDVKGLLAKEASNDDFLILQGAENEVEKLDLQNAYHDDDLADEAKSPAKDDQNEVDPYEEYKSPTPYLYLARGSGGEDKVKYRFLPMFSTAKAPEDSSPGHLLKTPLAEDLVGEEPERLKTLSWLKPAKVAWIEIPDEKDKIVSRYAYWVEDLQGKLNPIVAGNTEGLAGAPTRSAYPGPASKPIDADEPALNVLAVHALDPKSGDIPVGDITRKIIEGRPAMISPDSILGATAYAAPQIRSEVTGLLEDPLAAALERNVSPAIQDYREQPVVPYAAGISDKIAGKPKLNLNSLLKDPRPAAVDRFAKWIDDALPDFANKRKGGFPDDYLKTLAANTFDYADTDKEPSVSVNSYRGLDTYPMLSEIVLKIEYLGYRVQSGRLMLNWRFRLFGELWNMTNHDVEGSASLSYEAALNHTPIGSGTTGIDFDNPEMLRDPKRSSHNLEFRNGLFFSKNIAVRLRPDEYKFYQFAQVQCSLDVGANNISYKTPFYLQEKLGARGVSVMWNDVETERVERIVRDTGDSNNSEGKFVIDTPKTIAKAALPGAGYGPYGDFINNMGDPRMSLYFRSRSMPLSENSVKNLSPNRRNVRRSTIYDSDGAQKRLHYGRTLPGEWPDGGHNSPIGSFTPPASIELAVEPTDKAYDNAPAPVKANAPMRISNEGRFYSVAELGNIYDLVMWFPTYPDLAGKSGSGDADTKILNMPFSEGKASMPGSRNAWPEIANNSVANADYGGGNTLRIGRAEHELFDVNGKHAAHLLDLFHAGDADTPLGEGASSSTVEINGSINVNTAGKDVLRAMAAGMLKQDPELRKVTSWDHDVGSGRLSPKSELLELGSPKLAMAADRIAEGIMRSRPFASMKDLASARLKPEKADDPVGKGEPIFGNKKLYSVGDNLQWSDAAAEEVFARVHDASTLRSRNFRVWVIGQAIVKTGDTAEVLAESRKVFTVFADPGQRESDGAIDPLKSKPRVIYENDF